ncbi:MAG: Gfo/Idh/MocA family oxidoreductase [Capsulimonadaceae bacterium]|nr:Gfo/Idh/MocA family oxidoreductase [Capsulimonadaceae bacterium]
MSKKPIHVAQVGCGRFAAGQDMPNFKDNSDIECLWCCDSDIERARSVAAQFGIPHATSDLQAVLADPDVDLIKIATSHEAHLPIIEAAAAAGKHVFCEKPLALDPLEGLKIVRAVRRGGIKLGVDYNRTCAPAIRRLREVWQEHVAAPRHNPWRYIEIDRPLYPDETSSHLLVRIQDDSMTYVPVHMDPLRGGGPLIGETVHWLDLSCWFFAPQVPVEILGWGSERFTHGVNIKFSGGDSATILFHCAGTFDYPKELYEVTSNGALLRSEHFVENNYYGIPGLGRELFDLQFDCMPGIGDEGGLSGWQAKFNARVQGMSNCKEGFSELNVNKGHRAMLAGVIDAIRMGGPTPCDEFAGLRATYLARLAGQSIRLRQSLPVPVDQLVFDVL